MDLLDNKKKLEKKQKQLEAQKKIIFQRVFSTREGEDAKKFILADLGFFNKVYTEEQKALHNFAHYFLDLCGGIKLEYNLGEKK